MYKAIVVGFCLFMLIGQLFGQKLVIDTGVYNRWPSLSPIIISNNGKYVCYAVDNYPVGHQTLIIQSTNAKWKVEFPDVSISESSFTLDSRMLVFKTKGDTIGLVSLGTSKTDYISTVSSFKVTKEGRGNWLAYQLGTPEKTLVVRNLISGKEQSYQHVNNYWLTNTNNTLILQIQGSNPGNAVQVLQWVDLATGTNKTIWEGKSIGKLVFDPSERQIAFAGKIASESSFSLWHYQQCGFGANLLKINSSNIEGYELAEIEKFNPTGSRVNFWLKEKDLVKPNPAAVQVNVWSYTDAKLQTEQLLQTDSDLILAAIDLESDSVFILNEKNERIYDLDKNHDYVLSVINEGGSPAEPHWNKMAKRYKFLKSTRDASLKPVHEHAEMSPAGKYLTYYEEKDNSYHSYEISTGIVRNISAAIPYSLTTTVNVRYNSVCYGIAAWLMEDEALLIYDQYDVWKVDPAGNSTPVNLTNGFGRKHHIELRLVEESFFSESIVSNKQTVLLSGFNRMTMDNGFYKLTIGRKEEPKHLNSGAYTFFAPQKVDGDKGMTLLKAKNAGVYIVRRESAAESPNYFATTDFKNYTRLSNLRPEQKYNWYKTELHTWKSLDGTNLQGVLYKPEDFDPSKKYPVIFYYYELNSEDLNVYIEPNKPSNGSLNIPWYVSNGYLVFTPDIIYKTGDPGQSALNSVVSAAQYMSEFPFVLKNKLGIQGHSFGGFETNYIVSHSNIFAAACSAAGVSDLISLSGSIRGDAGFSQHGNFDRGQHRMWKTLWEIPELYIKNSPVFNADQVVTPVLIMHNRKDVAVPFDQSVEFFTALRRLGKRAWMLEYDNGQHGVRGADAKDFSLRMSQFFDHYLKDKPAPKWMTRGIPARFKGIETGLEYDSEIKTPGEGLLTKQEKEKVEALMKQKPLQMTIK